MKNFKIFEFLDKMLWEAYLPSREGNQELFPSYLHLEELQLAEQVLYSIMIIELGKSIV